jgi:hypothetical protein
MERGRVQLLSCAIYTRGGLEQGVNSLAPPAQVIRGIPKSQHGEGWCLVKDRLR